MSATMSNTTSSLKVGLDKKRRAYLNQTETFQASADFFQASSGLLLIVQLPFLYVYFAVCTFIFLFLNSESLSSIGGPIRYLVFAVLYITLAIILFPIVLIFGPIFIILGAFGAGSDVEATGFDNDKFRTMEALATQFQGMNDNIVKYQTNNVVMSKEDLECSLQALSCEMNL
jgi:membrane glycosyltransferase